MQEKQYGHSAVTSAGTPPFICWEVCNAAVILLHEGKMQALTRPMIEYSGSHNGMR